MKTRGAIIRSAPGRYETVELNLDEPRQGEIRVKMVATGMCHSDDHFATGDMVPGVYPWLGGHEGGGIVEAVGPNTPGWEVGDHIVTSFLPACGRCRWCAEGMQNLCDLGATLLQGARFNDPDSYRVTLEDGSPVGQMCGIGTFAERIVISVDSAIKVDKDLPLDVVCLLGCAVGTGWGSSVNAAQVEAGDVVVVIGIGGVGINAVQGARHAGADHVIAVDPVEFKREKALELGATRAYATADEAIDYARSITNGQGADKAVVTVGITTGEHIAQGFASIRKGGTLVCTGIGNMTAVGIPLPITELVTYQKRIQGTHFGHCSPNADIPRQIQMYRDGKIKLDEIITKRYTLDQIAEAYEDMHDGKIVRGVVVFD
ncbi:NDMA-dependent alcohol dehydrogenase [Leucobacter weissii]|uniref:NDMA-dependent alcohol dehydrogenase n=1 Tax=Leucobacter weissii TaxID=1983706 RepID=A0A939MP10_9MICO|nr:NDMA-dependent alcohol dehydrogenase [Leucobacter weissii]MBO1902327.1 NDMA-dependent alcohol dehydrogenase [Leucobacter weissii]